MKTLQYLCLLLIPCSALAGPLDEMSLDRWAKLREAERYQLNIAEKYYRDRDWKVAYAEYEKFLTLYETSEGAPYAQLKWGLCLVQQRKLNTAIKDGFQSVIDYWPDSPEAVAAAYYIASTYKDMGDIRPAKKAYADVLARHPDHFVAVLARADLIQIARAENDTPRRVQLWRELTYDTPRNGDAGRICSQASRELATHYFASGSFDEGLKALATTYKPEQLPAQVLQHADSPIRNLAAQSDTRPTAQKVADAAIAWLRGQMPQDLKDEAQKTAARQHWFYIADLYGHSARPEKIPEVYDQMVKLFGVDDGILERLAAWYKSQDRRDEARQTYARFADKINGQSHIAQMYREEKNYDGAAAIYQRLAGEDMPRQFHWRSLVAQTHREAGKVDEAVAVYRQLLTDDAEHANQWQWQIAHTYRERGRYKEAIASFRLCTNFPENYQQMAWCHRQLKEYKEAVVLYSQILGGHEPSAPWALLQIGYTQEQAGEKENAIKTFQQVCRRYPKTGQASEAHAYLQDKYKINATLGGATSE